jgi:PKD repeat protein
MPGRSLLLYGGGLRLDPTSINSGTGSTLSWAAAGATSIAITPGTFTSTSASGSTSVSPTATTTYTLTATNAAGSTTSTLTVTVTTASKPTISSFTASPTSITSGSSSTLSWATTGATSIAITPGTFTSTSASGSTSVSPTATTTYTLTATNASGSTTSTAKVTVTASGGPLAITTTSCPGGTQGAAYAGCTIVASGGTPPYTYSVSTNVRLSSIARGDVSQCKVHGNISSSLIGGQGTYIPEFVVTDSTGAQATQDISFAINGSNAFLANIFPSTSIFHHRVDAATTGLPVDTSPAAPMYSGYLSETVKPFFGNNSYANFPNGIPAIEVPYNQPDVSVTTTVYQSYFTSGPIPAYAPVEGTSNSTGDRHVLVYLEAGGGNNPALYEMWQGIYEGGPWTDSSNALWPNVSSNNLTPARAGNIRCRGTSGSAAARQCRRGHRHRHAQRAERYDSASHPIHAQPYVELLGLARYANSGRGELHGYGREFHSRGIANFAIFSSRKLHHVRTRWRDLSAQGFRGDSLLRRHKSASGHYHHRIPKLWNHPGRQRRQRRADRHARRSLER